MTSPAPQLDASEEGAIGAIKVAHVTTVDISLDVLLLPLLKGLKRAGYDVTGVSAPGSSVGAVQAAGIHHVPVPMTRKAFAPLADLRAFWRLYRAFRDSGFRIVHTHTPKAGIYGRWAARLARVPIVVHTSHGLMFHEKSPAALRILFTVLERAAAVCSDLVFSVNLEDLETMVRLGIAPTEKLRLHGRGGLGVDVEHFRRGRLSAEDVRRKRIEIGVPQGARVVGFVGRLVREKGLPDLLAAVRSLRTTFGDGLRLLVVGPRDDAKGDAVTPTIVDEYGLADVAIFTGMRSRQEMPELYALMNVLVLPSRREGFGLVLAEAASMSVPVVATDIRGCREAVESSRNGMLVPVGDVPALASALHFLLSNPREALRMGEEGRRLAVERFDERLVCQGMIAEYGRLLREKGVRYLAEPRYAARVTS
jgi:glycosyltransferase involved in cell wall biosynthesis